MELNARDKRLIKKYCQEFVTSFQHQFLNVERIQVHFEEVQDVHSGLLQTHVVLCVVSESPWDAIGAYFPFEFDSNLGFCVAYLRGWLASKLNDLGHEYDEFCIHLDVQPREFLSPIPQLSEIITVKRAAEKKILIDGPFATAVIELQIPYILVSGNKVSGPSIGMCNVLQDAISAEKPLRLIDAFSGSGALSAIGVMSGVKEVVSIDHLKRSLPALAEVMVMHVDFFDYIDRVKFDPSDLLLLDPYYGTARRVIKRLLQNQELPYRVILNGGRSLWKSEQKILTNLLENVGFLVSCEQHYGEAIYLATRT